MGAEVSCPIVFLKNRMVASDVIELYPSHHRDMRRSQFMVGVGNLDMVARAVKLHAFANLPINPFHFT